MTSSSSLKRWTWRQVLEENPRNDASDKDFGGIPEQVAVKVDKKFEEMEEQLLHEDALVLMMMTTTTTKKTSSSSSSEATTQPTLTFLHHLAKVEAAMGTKDNKTTTAPVYVALEGIGEQAQPVEISLEKGFGKVELTAPTWETLKALDSPDKLVNSFKKKEASSSTSDTTYFLRKIQFLPPFLHKVLLQATPDIDRSPATLLVEVLRAIQAHAQAHGTDEAYDDADVFCRGIVAFLWNFAAAREGDHATLISSFDMVKPSEAPEVLEWSKKLHHEVLDADKKKAATDSTSLKDETVGPDEVATSNGSTESKDKDADNNTTPSSTAAATKPPPPAKKTRTWQENFLRLVAYKNDVGDCNVPREYVKDKALGEWVKNQRSVSKTLPKERRAQLEEVGFTFSSTQLDRSKKIWDANYERLKLLATTNGGSFSKALKEDRSLQHWVTIQRQSHRRGNLDDDRKKLLDELDFVWKIKNEYTPRKKNDMQWQKGYTKLVEFYNEHKHCNVPKRPMDCRPLWEWVYSQRKAYNEKRLPADRIQLMEDLGMVWDKDMGQVIRDQQWNDKYEDAKVFFDKHQHLEVPRSGKFGDTNLLKWLLRQREQFKNDKLGPSRKKMLDDLKFDFEGNTESRDRLLEELNWKDRKDELEAYKKEKGTIPEGGTTATEKSLAKWVAKQQVAYQFHDLEPSRKAILDELGVVFPAQTPEPPMKKRTAPSLARTAKAIVAKVEKESEESKAREASVVVDQEMEESKEKDEPMVGDKEAEKSKDKEVPSDVAKENDSEKTKEVASTSKADDSKTANEAVAASLNDDNQKAAETVTKSNDDECKKETSKDDASKEPSKDVCTNDEPKGQKRKAEAAPAEKAKDETKGQKRKVEEAPAEKAKEQATSADKNGKKVEQKDNGRKVRRTTRDRGKSGKDQDNEHGTTMFI